MRIGIDFDNTIVRYDRLFHRVALDAELISAEVPVGKVPVRDHLRAAGKERSWIELQGLVYGARMGEAEAWPGVLDFMRWAGGEGHTLFIISHRTLHPALGPPYDLHRAARDWAERTLGSLIPAERIFFETTKAAKLARIRACACDIFIDDLPEILLASEFPDDTLRVLFDPDGHHGAVAGLNSPGDWSTIRRWLIEQPLRSVAAALWWQAFGTGEEPELIPCPVSGNNRVFIARAGDRIAVAKWYYRGPPGSRDRLDAEWRLLRYTARAGIAAAPKPLACAPAAGLAFQEFLEGRRPLLEEIGPAEVDAAAAFLRDLNDPRHRPLAADLPEAAEACFCAVDQFAMVDHRLERLRMRPVSAVDREAAELIAAMNGFWRDFRLRLAAGLEALGEDLEALIPPERRWVSPADFGFHNAMLGPDGGVRFFDFEYGGWDDPAKTIDDFFLQPALPIPAGLRERFADAVLDGWPDGGRLRERAQLMYPMFALKWCCIMLNPFAGQLSAPARFADPEADESERKRQQLDKALAAFKTMTES